MRSGTILGIRRVNGYLPPRLWGSISIKSVSISCLYWGQGLRPTGIWCSNRGTVVLGEASATRHRRSQARARVPLDRGHPRDCRATPVSSRRCGPRRAHSPHHRWRRRRCAGHVRPRRRRRHSARHRGCPQGELAAASCVHATRKRRRAPSAWGLPIASTRASSARAIASSAALRSVPLGCRRRVALQREAADLTESLSALLDHRRLDVRQEPRRITGRAPRSAERERHARDARAIPGAGRVRARGGRQAPSVPAQIIASTHRFSMKTACARRVRQQGGWAPASSRTGRSAIG